MSKINILVNLLPDFFKQTELKAVFNHLEDIGEVRYTSHNTPEEIADDLCWADAVIMWSWPTLDEALLEKASKLKYRGHLDMCQVDAKIALSRNMSVSLSKGCWSPAVSEMALTLMLNLLRKVSDYHAAMRKAEESWVEAFPTDIDVTERQLTGRSVCIVGLGAVGQGIARLLAPFNCKLNVVDPYIPDEIVAQYQGRKVNLEEGIENSEIVLLCAASNKGTRSLIGEKELALFQKDAILINLARAVLIDTDALLKKLKQNDMMVALDVFDTEPLEKDSPLRSLPNAYLTPHRAGALMVSVVRGIQWLVDDLENHLAGRDLKYPLLERMVPGLDNY